MRRLVWAVQRVRSMHCLALRTSKLVALALCFASACGQPFADVTPPPDDDASPMQPTDPMDAAANLDVNDVSILLPLAASSAQDQLLRLSDAGPRGQLLGTRYFEELPPLLIDIPPAAIYGSLRVVALRFDPCFPGDGGSCRRQLRLVAQPLRFPGTEDAAVHLFYELSPVEAQAVARRLLEIKALSPVSTTGRALGVHPGLVAQGTGGPLGSALRRLILDQAGEANLSRVAFMGLRGFGNAWSFGAFDVQGGKLVATAVPHVAGTTVDFAEAASDRRTARHGSITPRPMGGDDAAAAIDSTALQALPRPEAEAAIGALLRIENPQHGSPLTVDCVSCHVATRARLYGERLLGLDTTRHPARYLPPAGTTAGFEGMISDDSFVLRAFGYTGARPDVSQRLLNESARVVELTRALLQKP